MENFESLSSIISNPTWDIIAVLVFVLVGFFYGLSVGRSRLVSILVALYTSKIIFDNFLFLEGFVGDRALVELFLFRAGVFVIISVLVSIIFYRLGFKFKIAEGVWWKVFLLSFLSAGLFISMLFQMLPSLDLFEFSPVVQNVFASPSAYFWWLSLPIPALFIIMRKQ